MLLAICEFNSSLALLLLQVFDNLKKEEGFTLYVDLILTNYMPN